MSRRDGERLQDILEAIDAIRSHVARGGLADGLVFDAVRVRLIEIGEAIKTISTKLLDTEPGPPGVTSPACVTGSPTGISTRTTATSPGLSNTTSSHSKLRCCDSRTDFPEASNAASPPQCEGTYSSPSARSGDSQLPRDALAGRAASGSSGPGGPEVGRAV